MKSKALVLEQFNQPLAEKAFTVLPLEPGQVLVRVKAAGVCGSDVHMWRGEDPRTPLPMILGHEGVGEIVDMRGRARTVHGEELAAGDTILWNRGIACGRCYYCTVAKDPSLCTGRQIYGINRSCSSPPYLNGCYSEYIILEPGTDMFRVDGAVDPAILVPASCSGATVAHAFDLAPPREGDTVVVQGPGPLGIFAVAFARAHGASRIVVIGGSAERLALCREFGVTMVLNRNETTVEERREAVMSATYGRGADLVVEAAGYPSALEEGLELVRSGGTYLSTGYAQPLGEVKLDPYRHLVRKNLRLQGVWVSDTSHTYRAMQLVMMQQELFAKMVTHRFALAEANTALAAMRSKHALKAVLIP